MAMSPFGVEHVVAKRDRGRGEALGAAGAGTTAYVAGKAEKDLHRVAPARRIVGALKAVLADDPDKLASHIRGAKVDATRLVGLRYVRHGATAAAAGLGGAAVLGAVAGRKPRKPRQP